MKFAASEADWRIPSSPLGKCELELSWEVSRVVVRMMMMAMMMTQEEKEGRRGREGLRQNSSNPNLKGGEKRKKQRFHNIGQINV